MTYSIYPRVGLPSGLLPPGTAVTMEGDVIGPSDANLVNEITQATGTFRWAQTAVLPQLGVEDRTTDALPGSVFLRPGRPYTLATGVNRHSGDVVLLLGTPTNGGTTEARLVLVRGNSLSMAMGPYDTSLPSYSGIWFGVGPYTAGNPAMLGDGVFATHFTVGMAGTIFFDFGANPSANGSFSADASTGLHFSPASTMAALGQQPQASDIPTNDVTIFAQDAYGPATGDNRYAGWVILQGGEGTGHSFHGGQQFVSGDINGLAVLVDEAQSTSSSTVEIFSIPTAADTAYQVKARVVGVRIDTPTPGIRTFEIYGSFKNVAGVLTQTDDTGDLVVYDSGPNDSAAGIGIPTLNAIGTEILCLSHQPGSATINWIGEHEIVGTPFFP